MTDFLIYENYSFRLAEPLGRRGHGAHHVRELGLAGESDASILLAASGRGLILITQNYKDFLNLHQAWRLWSDAWIVSLSPVHPGILCIPQLPISLLDETAEAIAQVAGSGRRFENELYHWSLTHGWDLQPT